MLGYGLPILEELPEYGWRASFSHKHETKCQPFSMPRLSQLPELMTMSLRYLFRFWIKKVYREKRRPFIDGLNPVAWRPIYGAPLGGIGAGTIGRGFRGEFCRYQMVPGMYEYSTVMANQFIVTVRRRGGTVYQQVLSPHQPPSGSSLNAWNWGFCEDNATYHALYPRSWTVYDIPSQKLRLICRQVSPIIPNDYKDSSLPCGVFVWEIKNFNSEPVEVTITFTFKNGDGTQQDSTGGVRSERILNSEEMDGCLIHQVFNKDMPCIYGVGVKRGPDRTTSTFTAFNPANPLSITHCLEKRSGQYARLAEDEELPGPAKVWNQLMNCGQLYNTPDKSRKTIKGEELAVAVACLMEVKPEASAEMQFSLAWHMPRVHFKSSEIFYRRRYARWFEDPGASGAIDLLTYALANYRTWERKIEEWQMPILNDRKLPDWYKSGIFNELYFIADGGTVWLDIDTPNFSFSSGPEEKVFEENEIKKEMGIFGYLEGHEYRMYNTYDVHYYGSWALAKLWPKIQLSVQYDFARAAVSEDTSQVLYIHKGCNLNRKERNGVPHDLGDPEDEPFLHVNAYIMYPTHDWKDLNPKFVLTTYRDWKLTGDINYLRQLFPLCLKLMEQTLLWDLDGDGLIENGGYADQTYDAWKMTGPSAYCGGLWLGALYVTACMARDLGDVETAVEYETLLSRAREAYESRLWTGSYYKYDCSSKRCSQSIMSDQLNGHWYVRACGAPEDAILPSDRVRAALETVFKFNCKGMKSGQIGAINGVYPNGQKDTSSVQAEEFWIGINYAVAANMVREGMVQEGMELARGTHETTYHGYGLQFQTPEAYLDSRHYRSLGYMRPLSIWAMQHAIEQVREETNQNFKRK